MTISESDNRSDKDIAIWNIFNIVSISVIGGIYMILLLLFIFLYKNNEYKGYIKYIEYISIIIFYLILFLLIVNYFLSEYFVWIIHDYGTTKIIKLYLLFIFINISSIIFTAKVLNVLKINEMLGSNIQEVKSYY